jgi:light-regulated signal transduction histidine kinase (bacteriophytochrome)
MEQLIQELLTYSRVVHDTEQQVGEVDLNEVVRAALKYLEPAITDTDAKNYELPCQRWRVTVYN